MANNNKVYINPNFNKLFPPSPSATPPTATPHSKLIMHVNPNFSRQTLSHQSKIYVNPNFLKANNRSNEVDLLYSNKTLDNLPQVITSDTQINKVLMQQLVSKTRYTLVRQNTDTVKRQPPLAEAVKSATTIKINKYKSVDMKKFKKNLEASKYLNKTKSLQSVYNLSNAKQTDSTVTNQDLTNTLHSTQLRLTKFYRNKYKFCKPGTSTKVIETKSSNKRFSIDRKWRNSKLKVIKGLKKNNIPCPLYKKYGKCLRSINGTCDFLHDKKHVSICRKFLKGMCQEETCLLSHDISAKKMPTCYFYLKGICTKDNCPYLHVKLNEKSKICQDFLKGYCERGDMCFNLHTVKSYKQTKKPVNRSLNSSSHVIKKKSNSVCKSKAMNKNIKINATKADTSEGENSEPRNSECRYYSELIVKSENNKAHDAFKPSRCKLGILPSYIKL
ncbi:unnamed protein product [Diatraea saccharalis]|uniref:Zinc finger CCCH domain-containing protein 3 n=1 Tax=Diatraea saccharalis TaxID=40085 RepID=A0A9N9RD24_9NEOP|nr:unnamed protein product [Diatraea saccharalis]